MRPTANIPLRTWVYLGLAVGAVLVAGIGAFAYWQWSKTQPQPGTPHAPMPVGKPLTPDEQVKILQELEAQIGPADADQKQRQIELLDNLQQDLQQQPGWKSPEEQMKILEQMQAGQ